MNNVTQPFGNTLLIGAGPAAIQFGVDLARGWSSKVGLLNRKGPHADRLRKELEKHDHVLAATGHGLPISHLSGQVRVNRFYEGYENVDGSWNTVVLCTPSDSYREIVQTLQMDSWPSLNTVILLSPGFGSNLLVANLLNQRNDVEVVSLSTYYAATKFDQSSVIRSVTKALKKRVYLASNKQGGTAVRHVKELLERLGVQCTVCSHPVEAESRGITTYVHPPLFLHPFSLQEIFRSDGPSRKSMYKIYPEGPITQHSIRAMVRWWKEYSGLLRFFGFEPVNLLQFLNDDNYPVPEASLSREDIETFPLADPIKQEYLLYIRYSSLLIDPFSIPDQKGRYFDFSAVPYKQVYQDQEGRWVIPRIPMEDYKRLKLLEGLGRKANLPMPQARELIECFEDRLSAFLKEKGRDRVHPDVWTDTTREEAEIIWKELGA